MFELGSNGEERKAISKIIANFILIDSVHIWKQNRFQGNEKMHWKNVKIGVKLKKTQHVCTLFGKKKKKKKKSVMHLNWDHTMVNTKPI